MLAPYSAKLTGSNFAGHSLLTHEAKQDTVLSASGETKYGMEKRRRVTASDILFVEASRGGRVTR